MTDRTSTNYIAEMGVVALAGLTIGLVGPFGTETMPLAVRFAYWIGGFLIAWAAFRLVVMAMREITKLLRLPDVVSYILAVPLLSALIMIVFAPFGGVAASPDTSVWFYLRIVGVAVAFFALFWIFYFYANRAADDRPEKTLPGKEAAFDPSVATTGLTGTPLHEKLPVGFGPIIALQVEDHYVKVHSVGRSEMVLMNLSEAVDLMGPDSGLQVHRSWWVARSAVNAATRSGRNLQLEITGGITAPVSRSNVAAVRQAGWLNS